MTLDTFTKAYCEAAIWTSTEPYDEANQCDGEPLDKNYSVEDIHPESLHRILDDCNQFQDEMGQMFTDEELEDANLHRFPYLEQAGHDFWLTRNGHGCGFWETSDWKSDVGNALDKLSKKFGESYLYVGDDNKLHTN